MHGAPTLLAVSLIALLPSFAAAQTGTLTPANPSCTIAANAGTCSVTLTWTTTNPVGTSQLTSSWPSANTVVGSGNSGSASAQVPIAGRAFFLYNNAKQLATSTATASCAAGTTWNGSVCQGPMSGTLTPASPSCTIPSGAGTCNVVLTWATTNPVGTSAVASNWPSANYQVATGNSGSTSAPVPFAGRAFYLFNSAQQLATSNATASCASGTTWNGTICQGPMSGTLTPAAPACTIAAGASTCNVALTWSTMNPVGTSAVTSNWPSANYQVATGNSGSASVPVPFAGRAFYLFNSAQQLATSNATASCVSGTTWNGTICQGPMSGTLTPAAPSCTIAAGTSTCDVTLTWTTTNPVGTSAVTSSWPSANYQVAAGNSGSTSAPVPFAGRAFYLFNSAQQLAASNATASCVSGTAWNGSVCQAPTMSGTLTPASPACTIAAGASTCDVTLTWTTTNPVGTSAVTSNWPSANYQVAAGNSGSTSAPVPFAGRVFYLFNSAQQLASSNATASCAAGTTWNGTVCQGPMTGILLPSVPTCTIAAGASTCDVTLTWSTTNPVGTSQVTSSWPSANIVVATGNGGSTAAPVPFAGRTFYLFNSAQQLATSNATASCVSGTTWNGTTCQGPMAGTLTPASPSCTIAAGASTCDVTLTWATTNPVGTSAVTSNWPSANYQVATGNSGSTSVPVPFAGRTFYLFNSAQQLASSSATASCAAGTTWNGSACQAPTMSGSLTPAAPACTIAAGASTCNVTLTWTTTNPVATSQVTSNWPSANTVVGNGNSGSTSAEVSYNSRAFYLYNNAQLLATSNATASCAAGTTWNGSACQAPTMSGTLTPAAPACTIAAGASSCNVTLTWTTTNPVATSQVTSNWPSANTVVGTGNSLSIPVSVPFAGRAFYLYNNAQHLAASNATATCAAGSTWSGSVCQASTMSGALTPANPSCTIAAGAGTCDVTLTWTTTSPVGASQVTSSWPSANTVVGTGNNGSASAQVPFAGRAFYLYNNAQQLATNNATAVCAVGTFWNGLWCEASRPLTLTLTSTTGPDILAGQSYAIVVHAEGNLAHVDIAWNDLLPGVVERHDVSGSQADVPLSRQFDQGGTVTWKAWAYDVKGAISGEVSGTFNVRDSTIVGAARNAAGGSTPAFIKRVKLSPADPDVPIQSAAARTWLVIHGRNGSSDYVNSDGTVNNIAALARAVARARPGDQVLMVDWRYAAADAVLGGEAWIDAVGAWAGKVLASYGLEGQRIGIIGHSWGAYVGHEVAESIVTPESPGRPRAIVALDPAENSPTNAGYDFGAVDFSRVADRSWAFYSSILGNLTTASTASESFVVKSVEFPPPGAIALHRMPVDMFAAMIDSGQYASLGLDRLVSGASGPWQTNRFNVFGERSTFGFVPFEALVSVDANNQAVGLDFDPLSVVPQMLPAPPTGLRVASVAGNQLTFDWISPIHGPSVTGFQFEGGTTPGSILGTLPVGPSPSVTLALPTGSLFLRVRSVANGVVSAESNEVVAQVNVPAPPSAPRDLLGLALGDKLNLTWTNTLGGGESTALKLDVTGAYNGSIPLGLTDSFAFSGVPPGTYTFAVRASNSVGDSPVAAPVTLTFPGACAGAPQTPSDFRVREDGGTVFLSWDAPGDGVAPTGFVLNVAGAFTGSIPLTGRSVSAAAPPGTYYLSVSATNACGQSRATLTKAVTVP